MAETGGIRLQSARGSRPGLYSLAGYEDLNREF